MRVIACEFEEENERSSAVLAGERDRLGEFGERFP